jgi:5-methylcytosine-specific restriction protein A
MPRAPKYCGKRDCYQLVTGASYCEQHAHNWGKGNPRTSDPRHRAWRKTVLDKAHWRCQIRYADICVGAATIADHITATAFGGAEFDPFNGQGACRPCHDRKSSDEGHIARGHTPRARL